MCTRQSRINGSKFVCFFLSFSIQERTADSLYTLSLLQADRAQIFHLGTILKIHTHCYFLMGCKVIISYVRSTDKSSISAGNHRASKQATAPNAGQHSGHSHCETSPLFPGTIWCVSMTNKLRGFSKTKLIKKISLGRLSFLPFRETSRKANTRWYFNAWISPCIHLLQLWPS